MKPEQLNALKVAARKARNYLMVVQSLPVNSRNVRDVENHMEELLRIVEAVVGVPTLPPSFNDAPEALPGTRHSPRPASPDSAPTQAIGLMRSYLELPGSEVLTPDRWAKRVASYLFENLGSLP